MKWRQMTDRETTVLMILCHIVQLCRTGGSSVVPMKVATTSSMAGPLAAADQQFFANAIQAAVDHRLLGLQGADVFLSQYGKVFMAFCTLIGADPAKFEEETEGHEVIEHFVAVVGGEPRFDPPALSA